MTLEIIRTERLVLRAPELSDAPRIARFAGDPGVARMTCSFPLQQTVVGAEGWILLRQAVAGLTDGVQYAIDLPGEGLIGLIGAHEDGNAFEIGYWLGKPFWKRGYATEALQAVVARVRPHGPMTAGHFADNPASGRTLEKAGFVYTGEVTQLFSLARGESAPTRRMQLAA